MFSSLLVFCAEHYHGSNFVASFFSFPVTSVLSKEVISGLRLPDDGADLDSAGLCRGIQQRVKSRKSPLVFTTEYGGPADVEYSCSNG